MQTLSIYPTELNKYNECSIWFTGRWRKPLTRSYNILVSKVSQYDYANQLLLYGDSDHHFVKPVTFAYLAVLWILQVVNICESFMSLYSYMTNISFFQYADDYRYKMCSLYVHSLSVDKCSWYIFTSPMFHLQFYNLQAILSIHFELHTADPYSWTFMSQVSDQRAEWSHDPGVWHSNRDTGHHLSCLPHPNILLHSQGIPSSCHCLCRPLHDRLPHRCQALEGQK